MGDNYREGDLPVDTQGEGGVSEGAREQFQENLRKSQAAAKQIRKDESKHKAFDNTLAHFVSQLLQKGGHDQIVMLIAELVAVNVPSDFLLAVLSLQWETLAKPFDLENTALISVSFSADIIPHSVNDQFQRWKERILFDAQKYAEQILETIIQVETWKIHPALVTISGIMMQNVLRDHGAMGELQDTKQVCQLFFEQITEKLQEYMNQK